ncbi:MAG: AlkZ family DNA glycosylase [Anaerolineales bacterium]|nr:MAG: AlkZ family DNA glycosylase [Anaerolineales bacterium]
MKTSEIIRRRLANQHLVASALRNPLEVVSTQGAVQSQDFYGALWGLAIRLQPQSVSVSKRSNLQAGWTESEVEAWFSDGRILRLHILRPTWHFVAPADVRWMLMLSAPRVHALNGHMYRKLGVDGPAQKRALKIFQRALEGGQQLTRSELASALQAGGVPEAQGQRLAYFVMFAELEGLLTSGPRRGKQFTYMLLDERAPARGRSLARQDALAELARRYFGARGPATAHDFAWWSGLTVADCRAAALSLGELRSAELDGKAYWWSEARPPANSARGAWLLPNFDEYGIGFADRSHTEPNDYKSLWAGGALMLPHFYVINGRTAGMWKRELQKDEVHITLQSPFGGNAAADARSLKASIKRYGEFLGLKPVVGMLD